jgi:hypothetical protein
MVPQGFEDEPVWLRCKLGETKQSTERTGSETSKFREEAPRQKGISGKSTPLDMSGKYSKYDKCLKI